MNVQIQGAADRARRGRADKTDDWGTPVTQMVINAPFGVADLALVPTAKILTMARGTRGEDPAFVEFVANVLALQVEALVGASAQKGDTRDRALPGLYAEYKSKWTQLQKQ